MADTRNTRRDAQIGPTAQQERDHKRRVAEINQRAQDQQSRCADERRQIKEQIDERARREKRVIEIARQALHTTRVEGRARLAQKGHDCQRERRGILDERDAARSERGTIRTLNRQSDARNRSISAPRASTTERKAESFGEVLGNLPPDLVPLWKKVGRAFPVSAAMRAGRISMTEAFLQYAMEHPGEVIAAHPEWKPSRKIEAQEKEEKCHKARVEARKAAAQGRPDPRQLTWISDHCKGRVPKGAPIPF